MGFNSALKGLKQLDLPVSLLIVTVYTDVWESRSTALGVYTYINLLASGFYI